MVETKNFHHYSMPHYSFTDDHFEDSLRARNTEKKDDRLFSSCWVVAVFFSSHETFHLPLSITSYACLLLLCKSHRYRGRFNMRHRISKGSQMFQTDCYIINVYDLTNNIKVKLGNVKME